MIRNSAPRSYTRASRLDGPAAFAAVFAFKCRVDGKLFQVYAKPNGTARARLGIVVSKRVIARAVARNYCKRVAREVFRAERSALGGVDLIVRPRVAVSRDASAGAHAEMRDLLHRARAQCSNRDSTPRH